MKTMLSISPKQSKKSIENLTDSLCRLMKCAQETERDDKTTRAAFQVVSQAVKVENINITNCTFTSK